jgi:hypothetical protein
MYILVFEARVNQSVEDAKNPKTRDAVMLRDEINQLETQLVLRRKKSRPSSLTSQTSKIEIIKVAS